MKSLILSLITFSLLLSAPAFHEKKVFELSNNDSFSGYLKGDEHLNWIESDEGDILVFNQQSHRYEYAIIKENNLVPSGVEKAKGLHKRSLQHTSKYEVLELWKIKRECEFERRRNQH